MNPINELASIASTGRRMPRVLKNPETDGVFVTDPPSRPCPGCGHVTVDGDSITKVFYVWWHTKCAQ
jgi:tRNA (Thr-GGU) A37 N-methylase